MSENNYWIIKQDSINYYSNDQMNSVKTFDEGKQLTTVEELDAVSLGVFKENTDKANLLVVKDYVYAIQNGNYICYTKLTEIIDSYSLEVKPYKCSANFCFYVIGLIKTNKDLLLLLYQNPGSSCPNEAEAVSTITINNVNSNLKCELMIQFSDEKVLTCFYQDDNQKQIVARSFNINIQDESNVKIEEISSLVATKENLGAKVIRSILSQDGKKSLVCYINEYNNCECLIYDIMSNEWNEYSRYLDGCLSGLSSLNIEYFEYSDGNEEYVLYCFKTETTFELVTLDSNFMRKMDNKNGIYDFSENTNS